MVLARSIQLQLLFCACGRFYIALDGSVAWLCQMLDSSFQIGTVVAAFLWLWQV